MMTFDSQSAPVISFLPMNTYSRKYVSALILLLLLAGGAAGAVEIGSTVYLPRTNLGQPLSPLRNTLFQGDVGRFLRNQSLSNSYNTMRFQQTTESVFRELGITFGMSVPIKILQLSFEASFNAISGSERNVTAALILVESYSRRLVMRNEARVLQQIPIREDFLRELRDLPEPPENSSGNWLPYSNFLTRWGSHYVSAISYGSWLRAWSTAKSSLSYTQRQVTAKACAELTGGTVLPSVQGCGGISVADMNSASQLDMNVQVEVRGGEPQTMAALSVRRTEDLIKRFIEEGQRSDMAAVKYDFVAVWVPVLATYHSATSKEWRVAMALEGYYNGFLAFDCPPRSLPSPSTVLQEFRRTPQGTYQCVRHCQGCRTDRDCNLHGDGCYCYGTSCIIAGGEDGRATIQRQRDSLPRNVVPNRNCFYTTSLQPCQCRLASTEEGCGPDNLIPIWDQTRDSRLRSPVPMQTA